MEKAQMIEFAELVASAVVTALKKENVIGVKDVKKQDKTAFQKTEQLLFNYNGFRKVVSDRKQEIEDLKRYGVPRSCGVSEFVNKGGVPHGITLEEESVEKAIERIERSIESTVNAIDLIDKNLAALRSDPYYKVLEYRYFEGRTQEDIAVVFNCSQVTISNNKNRLIRELSLRLFPDQVIGEYMD